jgi:hypothetical protein
VQENGNRMGFSSFIHIKRICLLRQDFLYEELILLSSFGLETIRPKQNEPQA